MVIRVVQQHVVRLFIIYLKFHFLLINVLHFLHHALVQAHVRPVAEQIFYVPLILNQLLRPQIKTTPHLVSILMIQIN